MALEQNILAAGLIGFSGLFSWFGAFLVRRHAERLRLVQAPNHRSSHINPTPNGGGLGIVLAGAASGACLAGGAWWAVIGLGLGLAAVGFWDDIQHLPARVRFGAQLLVCGGLLAVLGVGAESALPAPTIIATVPLNTWILSSLLLLVGVWWINLFNFMDGIDGIAGAQAIFMLVAGALLAVLAHPAAKADPAWAWMLCIAAACAGFLWLNWPPAKIFMGDVGSTWLAFMIFALALLSVKHGWLNYPAWLVMAAVFVTDATVTLLTRMLRGERWYDAHRSHAYQRLSRRWRGHKAVTLSVVAINSLWLAPLAWACLALPQWAVGWISLAYLPLLVGALALKAGMPG